MKKTIIYFYIFLIFLLTILDYFFGKLTSNFGNPAPDIVRVFLLISSLLYILKSKYFKFFFINRFNRSYSLIILYLFILCVFAPFTGIQNMINFIRIIYPFILFMAMYLLVYSGFFEEKHAIYLFKYLVIICLFLIISFLGYKQSIGRMSIGDNKGYSLIFCIPIVFLMFPKKKMIIYYALTILGVLIAAKRGAFLGVVYSSIILFILFNKLNLKVKISLTLILSILLYLFYSYFLESIFIFERLENIAEDGASGRDILASLIYQGWADNDLINQIFGSGWMSQLQYIKSTSLFSKGLTAHNDWLQLLYDGGIVGVSLLLIMFFRLFKLLRAMKVKSTYYYALLCCSGIFFLRSISGGTFGDTSTIIYCYLALAFILGKIDRDYRIERTEIIH